MLRTQAKKQSSFYVCASCRRQHQRDLAQLRSSGRIRSHHLLSTPRPFAPVVPTASKLATSLAPRNGAIPSRDGPTLRTTRIDTRSYSAWERGNLASQTVPQQSNSAWAAAPKNTPTTGKPSPAAPVWGAPSKPLAATGTSAWGGASKSPLAAGASAWGGPSNAGPSTTLPPGFAAGNRAPSGSSTSVSGGGKVPPRGDGAAALGGVGSRPSGSVSSAWSGSAGTAPDPIASAVGRVSSSHIPLSQPTPSPGLGRGMAPQPASSLGGPASQANTSQGQGPQANVKVDAATHKASTSWPSRGAGTVVNTANKSSTAPTQFPSSNASTTPPMAAAPNTDSSRVDTGPAQVLREDNTYPTQASPTTAPSPVARANQASNRPPIPSSMTYTSGAGHSPTAGGTVVVKPAFGSPSGQTAAKPNPAAASSWTPSQPARGGVSSWIPPKVNAPKIPPSVSITPEKTASALLGNGWESSDWKQKGEVPYTAPPRRKSSHFFEGAQGSQEPQVRSQTRVSDPMLDTAFMRPPTRKPEPGAEFPQLPRRSSRRDTFETWSPFKLPPRQTRPSRDEAPSSDRRSDLAASGTSTYQAFEDAFQDRSVASNSGFPTVAKSKGHREAPQDDWNDSAIPSGARGPSPPRMDQISALVEEERRKPPITDQIAAPVEERERRRYDKKDPRGRGRDVEPVEDIYAAADRERRKKKFGGTRKQHVVDDEGGEDYEDYEQMRDRQQQRQRKLAEKRAAEEAEAAKHKSILLPEYITVYDLAQALRIKPAVFLRDLEQLGFENTLQDSVLTGETAALVAAEYGFETTVESGINVDLQPRPPPEDLSSVPPRPPIVTIMGHVDHGKTTILDTLRKSSIVAQEFGGITQHIGAFSVKMSKGKTITFLDTPGHAAFLSMRQRGANVTDIIILVVAVDDSVKPQTIEAIKHAQNAKVPIIVAINKVDLDDTPQQLDLVKQELAENGVDVEDYGGDVQAVNISGKTGRGMRDLEDAILTLTEVLDMRAETDGMAEGWVLETSVKPDGRAATILVKRGTLRIGDLIVSGNAYTRVRIMRNEGGVDVEECGPGTPIEVYGGWKGEPMAGDMVLQAPDETRAQTAVDYRNEIAERAIAAAQNAQREALERERAEREAAKKRQEEEAEDGEEEAAAPVDTGPKSVSIIVKGDVMGSVEAVSMAIQEIGNNEVRPRILFSSPGQITESDVDHMATAQGAIVNFNSIIPGHILQRADRAGVVILDHNIIYETVQAVKDLLSAQLTPIYTQRVVAEATVAQIFQINITKRKYKNIAGSKVTKATITRGGMYRVIRAGEEIHKGKLAALKQKQSDVNEVKIGIECGIMFQEFDEFEVGDLIQLYEDVEQKRYL